ncbi:hypothetical protein [Massilia phosphatilytica]
MPVEYACRGVRQQHLAAREAAQHAVQAALAATRSLQRADVVRLAQKSATFDAVVAILTPSNVP